MGLVGLVIFLKVMEIGISGISGISLLFERERFRDDAPWDSLDYFVFEARMVSR